MATELTMPMLGEVMEAGAIVAWKKAEGQTVEKGEIIVEIENDKAVTGVESPASGVLRNILVSAGQTVPVNTILAWID